MYSNNMKMNQSQDPKPFWKRLLTWKLIFIPIGLVLIIVVVKAGGHALDRYQTSKNISERIANHPELASCGSRQDIFTVSPVRAGEYGDIVPLGNFGPTGGHTIPTKHIYFMSTATDTTKQTDVNVYAPGDLTITSLEQADNKTKGYTDYYLYTSPCKEIEVSFYHLNSLNPKIMDAFDSVKKKNCRTEQDGTITSKVCNADISGVTLKAGDLLGVANPAKKDSIKQLFDFEMTDHRTTALVFANPARFPSGGFDYQHVVCPLDYFSADLKSNFLTQMGDYFDPTLKRTAQPFCGNYLQDIAGTAQGVWFKDQSATADNSENSALTLGHHNVLPKKGIFSVGTQTASTIEAGAYPFVTTTNGFVNRDFKDITADGQTYCYEPTGLTGTYNYPFRILLQLTSPTTLKIEGQKVQGCGSGPWIFGAGATPLER